MEKVQLITANDDLAINLQRHLGEELIHTDSVDQAVMNVSSGTVGTTVIHGYDKMTVLLRIVTFLRDACPSMAITCLVSPDNVSRVMNSELKPYIYRVLPNTTSAGQIVLAVNSSQKEHQALQEREALGENLTVQLESKDFSDKLNTRWANPLATRLLLLLMLLGSMLLAWYVFNQQSTVKKALASNEPNLIQNESPDTALDNVSSVVETEASRIISDAQIATELPTSTPPRDMAARVSSLLFAATNAQLKNQLLEPYADNARAYYQQILNIEPENQAAKDGMQQMEQQLVQRISDALDDNKEENAGSDFIALRTINPNHPELANLKQRLLQNPLPSIKGNLDRASNPPTTEEISPARLEELLQIQKDDMATTRLAQIDNALNINAFSSATNLLIRPRDDLSAYDREFQSRNNRLLLALTENIDSAIQVDDYTRADELIGNLAQLGYANRVTAFNTVIAARQEPTPAIIAPEETAPVADVVIGARANNVVPPVYPRVAERRNTEGYVVLRYRVLSNGDTADIEVLDAEPTTIFNQAAISSIQASSYIPATRNGIPEEQIIEQKLNFKLEFDK